MATKKRAISKKNGAPAETPKPPGSGSKYDNWIVWLGFAILIVVPLLFSRISNDQFDLVKLAAWRVLVLGMAVVWAGKLLTQREPIRWSWREGLLAAFLLAAIVSTFTSIHVPTSLHGKYRRYEGLLTYLAYFTMYFIFAQSFKGKKRLQTLIEIISITGAVAALYGVVQYLGLDPISWGQIGFEERRSFSTFGNPDLLAGYLVLAFPCSLAAYFYDHRRAWLHGVSAFILATGLLTALTRGGWLGALVAAVCLAGFLGRSLKRYRKKLLFLAAPIALVLAATVVYSSNTDLNIVSKLQGAFELNAGTALGRIEIWKAGWLMVKDRPLFGQGLDTYHLASQHFETLKYVQSVGGTTVSDNAHNYFIQLAAGGGPLAAVLIYGFFIAWIFGMVKVRRRLAETGERLLLGGIIAAVVGYLTAMIVGLSVVGAGSTFWLLLAAGTGFGAGRDPAYRFFDFAGLTQGIKVTAAAIVVVITMISAGYAVAMYAGDVFFLKGLVAGDSNNETVAAADFNTALRLYPANGRIMSEMGKDYYRWAGTAARRKDYKSSAYFIEEAIDAFERASLADPLEVEFRVFLANTYGTISRYDEALDITTKILQRRPYSVSANVLAADFLAAQGREGEAIKHYETILRILPASKGALGKMIDLQKGAGHKREAAEYQKRLDRLP